MATAKPLQLGMVGLGRMGANLARRAMRDGHHCVANSRGADAVRALAAEGATPAFTLDELVAALEPPRAVWVMVPAGATTESVVRDLADRLDRGRHDHRWRQHPLPRRHPPSRRARRAGHRLRRHRHERRRLGPGAWLLPHDRRPARGLRPPGADLRLARARGRRRAAHARSRGRARDGRARLPLLRAGGRRPLREDGAQRHRVRRDGGVRRGLERDERSKRGPRRRARRTRRPRRLHTPSTTATRSTCRP